MRGVLAASTMTTTLQRICQLWPQVNLSQPSPISIPNVDRWHSLTQLFRDLQFKVGAEIGVERGQFSKRLCVVNPGLKLYCVDPWLAYKGYREHVSQDKLDVFYEETCWRLADYDCTLIRKSSVEASYRIPDGSLDFVYIDGNHSLLHVIQDLHYWVPKVRKGGIVAGHDFIRRKATGYLMHVVQAVHAYTDAYEIDPWFVLGSKEVVEGELRDKPRSWMWVK